MKKLLLAVLILLSPLVSVHAGKGDFSPAVSGITGAKPSDVSGPRSHPNGLNSASFNRFTDSYGWAYYLWRANCDKDANGRFVNCRDVNNNYLDERDFIAGRKDNGGGNEYHHSVPGTLALNDTVLMPVLIHNSAKQGQFPAANTVLKIDWSNPDAVKATLTSSTANPSPFSDIVNFNMPDGLTFAHNGAKYGNNKIRVKKGGNNDVNVTSLESTSLTYNFGQVLGSYAHSQIAYIPLKVVNAVPKIKIVKTDKNPDDQDGTQENDTQTITSGNKAVFKITVTNTGTESLENVIVEDPEAPNCARTATQTRNLYPGNTFDPEETFSYTCEINNVDEDTFADGDNDAKVKGTGVGSGTMVMDEDPSVVVVEAAPVCTKAEFDPETVGVGEVSVFSWMTQNAGGNARLQCTGGGVSLNKNVNDNDNHDITPTAVGTVTCKIVVESAELCEDTLTVTADPQGPGIDILKWAANPNDKDGVTTGNNDANDTQTVESVEPDDQSIFRIRVENTGQIDLENVRVTDAKAPECSLTQAQVAEILTTGASSKATISNVNVTGLTNTDNILNVDESFRYDCTQDNVRDGYINEAEVVGEPVDGQPEVDDSDTTEVLVCNATTCPPGPNPSIEIVKTDENTSDYDEVTGNDTQQLVEGTTAGFKITVTNNGNEGLKDVVISDSEAPNCARTVTQTQALYPGTTFDPGETFTYNCNKPNARPGDFDGSNGQGSVDGHNDIRVDGTGVTSNTAVNDEDPSEVKFFPICTPEQGSISIKKDDVTPGQADTDGDDTQIVANDGTAEFTISVTNTGPGALTNVQIEDALSPSCAKTQAEFLALLGAVGNNDGVFDNGEIVTYTCEQTNVTASFTNSATVTGINNQHDCAVTDTDTTEVVVGGGTGFCGDGIVQQPEECDDGNTDDTDQCSNNCTTPGGGVSDSNPSVGACSVHPSTGAAQCTRHKPVEDVSDPLWQAYRMCRDGINPPRHTVTAGMLIREACALDWAEDQGLLLCGANFGGIIDPFTDPSAAQVDSQCGITTVCADCTTSCVAVDTCPGCFHSSTDIAKVITSSDTVAKGETVTYEITVDINGFNNADYEIVDAKIRVHDVVVPAESGHIWDRDGIVDGDDNSTWLWCDENSLCPEYGEYFYLDMENNGGRNYVNELNATGSSVLKVHYDMDTNVAAKYDAASLKNVAFAMVYYTYKNRLTGASHTQVVGIGNNVCPATPVTLNQFASGSFGSTATVNIIRPFVKARAGNAGYYGGGNEDKAFADQEGINTWNGGVLDPTDFNYGLTLTDDTNVYTPTDPAGPQGSATDFADFQDQQDAFYDNLSGAASGTETIGGVTFQKLPSGNVYQLDGADLDASLLTGISESSTFIITNGDVIISNDMSFNADVFAAFIIRDGDLKIDKDVISIDGLYLVESGEVKSDPDGDISDVQLKVSGNLYGDLGHLLSYRRYIGSGVDIEPSIEINFDLRLLDNTPPMLEQFLGATWREEIEG